MPALRAPHATPRHAGKRCRSVFPRNQTEKRECGLRPGLSWSCFPSVKCNLSSRPRYFRSDAQVAIHRKWSQSPCQQSATIWIELLCAVRFWQCFCAFTLGRGARRQIWDERAGVVFWTDTIRPWRQRCADVSSDRECGRSGTGCRHPSQSCHSGGWWS